MTILERSFYFIVITALALSYIPLIRTTLDSMFAYQLWDIGAKLLSALGAIVAGLAVYWKYHKEKNRQMFENRLREVYAPLLKLLIRQETYRALFMSDSKIEEAPIFYIINKNQHIEFRNGQVQVSESEELGLLKREDFIEALNKSSYGLARPKLLSLISQYELLIKYEDELRESIKSITPQNYGTNEVDKEEKDKFETSPRYKKFKAMASKRVDIELNLVQEIVDGYNDSIQHLGLDKNQEIRLGKIIKD